MDFICGMEVLVQGPHFSLIDEDADVRPDPLLLVDHPEAHPGMFALEIAEQLGDGAAARVHLGRAGGIGA
ncbi:MAG TPA: hypothetical protein VKC11_07630 [Steroidobacteraceae bacterium]|nr:hypothetical protein [Steroidobacteraceae bacterium]